MEGRNIVTTVPCPSSLTISIVPSLSSIICFAKGSPSPDVLLVEKPTSQIRGRSASLIPIPLS